MKRVLLLATIPLMLSADYVEIKTAEGRYGYTTSEYYPYVCYEKRIRVFRDGYEYLKYEGCMLSKYPCRSIGMVHFGRYPNNKESRRALRRCINATPRFVD